MNILGKEHEVNTVNQLNVDVMYILNKMVPKCSKWFEMVQNDSKWFKTYPTMNIKNPGMVPNGRAMIDVG